MNTSNKILIIGCVGCGKSTYARKLSKKLSIPVYGIDEIVHDDVLGVRRSLDEQKELISKVDSNDKWIIEGALRKELYFLLDMADLIIMIDIDRDIVEHRVITRYIRQQLGIENINYKVDSAFLDKMLGYVNKYYETKEDIFKMLEKYKDKLIIKRTI
jgi:adenylate kinase family enzyme